ncbi:unnamed protein product [Discosporangium mesarthrocarpum]
MKESFTKQCAVARIRNDSVLTQLRKANQTFRDLHELCRGDKRLANQKGRFLSVAERMYPTWQEGKMQQSVAEIHSLEKERFLTDLRRQAATESFEQESRLRIAVEEKRNQLKAVQVREHNELVERELLRERMAAQAKDMDQAIYIEATRAAQEAQRQIMASNSFTSIGKITEKWGLEARDSVR